MILDFISHLLLCKSVEISWNSFYHFVGYVSILEPKFEFQLYDAILTTEKDGPHTSLRVCQQHFVIYASLEKNIRILENRALIAYSWTAKFDVVDARIIRLLLSVQFNVFRKLKTFKWHVMTVSF